jgi:hypothetical protein
MGMNWPRRVSGLVAIVIVGIPTLLVVPATQEWTRVPWWPFAKQFQHLAGVVPTRFDRYRYATYKACVVMNIWLT